VKCPKCDGHKRYVDADRWRLLYYEMRSPDFRLQEGIRDRLEDEFRKVRATDWPTIIKNWPFAGFPGWPGDGVRKPAGCDRRP
jgi:hypothetical protein